MPKVNNLTISGNGVNRVVAISVFYVGGLSRNKIKRFNIVHYWWGRGGSLLKVNLQRSILQLCLKYPKEENVLLKTIVLVNVGYCNETGIIITIHIQAYTCQ